MADKGSINFGQILVFLRNLEICCHEIRPYSEFSTNSIFMQIETEFVGISPQDLSL